MLDLLFADGALWFTIPALLGTGVFIIRLVLILVAGVGHDVHLSVDTHDHAHPTPGHDSTHAFQILSVQGISAFLMGFGWSGLAGLNAAHWPMTSCLLVAFAGGVGMTYLLAFSLAAMLKLHASGNIHIAQAIGAEGVIYVGVPESGPGKVRLVIQNRQRIYNAVAAEPLPTSTRVRVLSVNHDNSLTVARA